MITLADGPFFTFRIVGPDGQFRLVQHDAEFPGAAAAFGWRTPERITAKAVWDAYDFLDNHVGWSAEAPGYFRRGCHEIDPANAL